MVFESMNQFHMKSFPTGWYAGTLVIEVQVPSQQPGHVKIWRLSHVELNTTHDNLYLQRLTTEVLESCFRHSLRAVGDREHRRQVEMCQSDFNLHQLALVNEFGNWFQQKHSTKGNVNSSALPSTSRRSHDIQVVDGAVRWKYIVTLLEDAEDWNKEH